MVENVLLEASERVAKKEGLGLKPSDVFDRMDLDVIPKRHALLMILHVSGALGG